MKRLLLAALALGLLSSSALPASAQSNSPAAGFFGSGGMSTAQLYYWYGRSPAHVVRDEHIRICATNPRAPCHRRYAHRAVDAPFARTPPSAERARAVPQVNGHAGRGCDSLCQSKCQAT